MSLDTYRTILAHLQSQGYDTSRLVTTVQAS